MPETDGRPGRVSGIIVAAGRSERMGGLDKVLAPLMGRPLLVWALAAFKRCPDIDDVVVVVAAATAARVRDLVAEWKFSHVSAVVAGGEERQDSVRAGLDAAAEASIVAVHDGARPLVTADLITRGVELARECGAAVCGVPSRDTVKQIDVQSRAVLATPERGSIWLAQTPQVFDRSLLQRAHERADSAATDDAELVEALGHEVRVYEGAAWNIKVTAQEDLVIAEALLRERLSV